MLAAFAVTLVNFAQERSVDAQTALTFLVFLIAFGGLHMAVRACAPRATPLLLAPVTALTALGLHRDLPARLRHRNRQGQLSEVVDTDRGGSGFFALLLFEPGLDLDLAPISKHHPAHLAGADPAPQLACRLGVPAAWAYQSTAPGCGFVLDVGFTTLQFQPAELAKLGLVAYVAGYLADHQRALREARRHIGPIAFPEPRQLIPLLITWGVSVLILISQRDLGASLLLFAGFVLLLYAATGTTGYLVAGGFLGVIAGVASYLAFDHVQRRVIAWMAPFEHYEDEGFQIAQGLFAMGTGSLSGAGPGLGRPDLIPNAATDFIFAAVGEELGFAGTVSVIALFRPHHCGGPRDRLP